MSSLHIGFTGTQKGMTDFQLAKVKDLLEYFKNNGFNTVHHGDCMGADKQFHLLADALGFRIVIHPPDNDSKRAFCPGGVLLSAKPYLERNRDIVKASHLLIAAPKENTEVLRSGTWATIRYAQKQSGMEIRIIFPRENVHFTSTGL
jgi:hypothetical protein